MARVGAVGAAARAGNVTAGGTQILTNPGVHGNLLIKYENMILLHEEPECVCPRCRRTSGTTLPGTRYQACSPRSGGTRATPATCCPPWCVIRNCPGPISDSAAIR